MDKRYLKNVAVYIVSAVLSVLVIIYIIYHLVGGFSQEVETMPADIVTVSETYDAEAYIFRDEKLILSNGTGSANLLFEDGTMVKKGAAVASIYSGDNTEDIKNQIADIDRQINILKNSAVAQDVSLIDSKTIDNRIYSLYYTIGSRLNKGDIDYVLRRKDELLTLLNKRQLVLQTVGGFDQQLAELENTRLSLSSSLGGVTETVYTDTSGYLYSGTDGYEGRFSLSVADSFTLDEFRALSESEPTQNANAVGKIVTDYKWYIACEMPSVHQQYYTIGNSYQVRFPYSNDAELPMELVRIVTDSDEDEILLVFSTGHVPKDFNFLRKQTVEIVQQEYTGYRVPVSAVRINDGKEGVYVKSGNVAIFKEIVTLAEIDGYFVVAEQDRFNDDNYAEKLGMHDLVIVKGKNLYENKIIQ